MIKEKIFLTSFIWAFLFGFQAQADTVPGMAISSVFCLEKAYVQTAVSGPCLSTYATQAGSTVDKEAFKADLLSVYNSHKYNFTDQTVGGNLVTRFKRYLCTWEPEEGTAPILLNMRCRPRNGTVGTTGLSGGNTYGLFFAVISFTPAPFDPDASGPDPVDPNSGNTPVSSDLEGTVQAVMNVVLTDAQTIFTSVLPILGGILALILGFLMVRRFVQGAAS